LRGTGLITCAWRIVNERLGFQFLPKVCGFSYQDDFGDYERVKQRSSIGEIRDLNFSSKSML
jgi:hypothetical protein